LKGYLLWPSLWKTLAPDKILAISENDKKRFAALFGEKTADAMPNIKFDRISTFNGAHKTINPLKPFLQPDADVLVLGSIRSAEEPLVKKIIAEVMRRHPHAIIGLFPRHMNRIENWKNELERLNLNVVLRSEVFEEIPPGTVILWDIFGELGTAYGMAKACFVGGSLAPLGGQNFLEAITYGLVPVIGPFWDNFAWVGKEIIDQKLVSIASDWKEVADILVNHLKHPIDRSDVQTAAQKYVRAHQGGTTIACDLICQYLKESQQQ
jgi:3-deoxy-D-manno-octulosonic-acid transferase